MKLLILVLLVLSMVVLFYLNKWLQHLIEPRRSFFRLIAYFVLVFALLFGYTFLFVLFISNLFPFSKG